MKYYKYSLLLLAILYFGCERDDICAEGTPTTPRLLVEFFDVTNIEIPKSVTRFAVYAERLIIEDGVITPPETIEQIEKASLIFNVNADEIALPLLIDDEDADIETTVVRYYFERDTNFRLDNDPTTESNIDIVEITYKPEFVYVSRACGFKSIFNDLQVELLPGDDGISWMQSSVFAGTTDLSITVENEDAAHVQIFF